jgi:phosphomannomutase/phosphoglucomutase
MINELPKTFQSPTMAPYCKDEEKYKVVEDLTNEIQKIKNEKIKIDNQIIKEILTINGIRFSLEDGSWGLIRASSNKPSLVIVTESPTSEERIVQENRRIREWEDQFDQEQQKKEDDLIKKFYSDKSRESNNEGDLETSISEDVTSDNKDDK